MTLYVMERGALAEYLHQRAALMAKADAGVLFDLMTGQEKPAPKLYSVVEGVAHITVSGRLSRKRDWIMEFFGLGGSLTYDEIAMAIEQADADPAVKSIALDINSPGGCADGVDVAAQAVARARKPTEARVDNLAASGAYWIASQAQRITAASPVAAFGSIGVVAAFLDDKQFMADMGLEEIVITSTDAPKKWPDPATEAGYNTIRKEMDDIHGVFAARVAEGRGVSVEKVNKDFGQGGVLIAADAQRVGMIDRVVGVAEPQPVETENPLDSENEDTPPALPGAAEAAIKTQEVTGMDYKDITLEILMKERPDVAAKAEEIGVQKERTRSAKLRAWAQSNPECASVVAEAEAKGQSEGDVMPQLMAAIRKAGAGEKPADPGEPPKVTTATKPNGAGVEGTSEAELKKQAAAIVATLPKGRV